jgi:aminoglycoside phosphotransferase (APT) family kinase protein
VAVDLAGPVREGEALDVDAVAAWLRAEGVDVQGSPEVTQFSGGASNWTYRLRFAGHDLILRRPPAGTKAKTAHDMVREFRVQRAIKPVYPAVPEMIALCTDEAVLGCDFYVMERLEGIIPRRRFPRDMARTPGQTRAICEAMLDQLAALHAVDYEACGLGDLGRGAGYVGRQISGWTRRYERAKTWNVPSFRKVTRWLDAQQPDDVATVLIHNDWRFDNCVLDPADPTRIIGVLDWEMATLGDPLMDLGSMLAYWVQPDDPRLMRMTQRQPTTEPGMLTRAEVVGHYLQRTGREVDNWAFYEVYGLFRLAVIAQQIYYRYFHKQTRNPLFRNFWILVNYFDWRCRGIIRRGRGSYPA